jgi:2,3-bisphosphoglycerate-dependent phosphoglycerate mutase
MSSYQFIAVRHGESVWNKENRFTGWADVDLSEKGRAEALTAATDLKEWMLKNNFHVDLAYSSVLKRAIRTLWIIQESLDGLWWPVVKDWRLNERHYGGLTGLNKAETAQKHGEDQVKIWRRSFSTPPPQLSFDSPEHPRFEEKYKNLDPRSLPCGESLKLTVERVLPFWDQELKPSLKSGKKILVVAHGNSLRALLMKLGSISEADIMEINIPTGIPFEMNLDENFKLTSYKYLASEERVQAAIHTVAHQGKK